MLNSASKNGILHIIWPIIDLNNIFEWIKNTEINNVNIEADKVYIKRNAEVTGLESLTITSFEMIFLENVTDITFKQGKPPSKSRAQNGLSYGYAGTSGLATC